MAWEHCGRPNCALCKLELQYERDRARTEPSSDCDLLGDGSAVEVEVQIASPIMYLGWSLIVDDVLNIKGQDNGGLNEYDWIPS